MTDISQIRTPHWEPSRLRSVLAKIAFPVFLLLNRPSLSWFGDLVYDFALRCNGVAITFGGREGLTHSEERFLRRYMRRFAQGVLLDVGANHGAYARLLRKLAPAARVVAFEPHPSTFALLKEIMADMPDVELVNQAVGEIAGELKLYDFGFADGSTQASLSEAAIAFYSRDIVEHRVACTTIDEYMAAAGIARIDFLKIDTEGHDLAVLKGARRALRDRCIRLIQFEFIPANIATGATMHAFFEALEGYRIGRLCLNGEIRWFDAYDVKRCEIFVTHNLIAVPMDEPL